MNRSIVTMTAAWFLALAACDKPASETTTTADPADKNGTTETTTAETKPEPLVIADDDVATPADFEEAAETSITKANYKAELATLETDIDKD
jgi:hypothetical protein